MDYCITGITTSHWTGQIKSIVFTAWRLDASQQSCLLSGSMFGGWTLLSSTKELKVLNEIGERKLAECLRKSYS